MSKYGVEGFRVRLRTLSKYGSVTYLAKRPTRETHSEQYSDTVLPKVTERAQNADFAENRGFSQIHPFSWKFKQLEGTGNRRKPQILAGNRRFSQKTADHLTLKLLRRPTPSHRREPEASPPVRCHSACGAWRLASCGASAGHFFREWLRE